MFFSSFRLGGVEYDLTAHHGIGDNDPVVVQIPDNGVAERDVLHSSRELVPNGNAVVDAKGFENNYKNTAGDIAQRLLRGQASDEGNDARTGEQGMRHRLEHRQYQKCPSYPYEVDQSDEEMLEELVVGRVGLQFGDGSFYRAVEEKVKGCCNDDGRSNNAQEQHYSLDVAEYFFFHTGGN